MKKEGLKYVILHYFVTRRNYKVRIYSTCLLDTDIAFIHIMKKLFYSAYFKKAVIVILKVRLFFCIKLEQYHIDYTH